MSTVSALRQEGSKFFGGPLLPSGTIFLLPQRTRMTATAIMFTDSGFAIAADGNQLWGHKPTRNAAIRTAETYCAQKIFGVEAESVALAYIVRGDVANADKTFDAALELKRSVAVAIKRRSGKPRAFVEALGDALEHTFARAVRAGQLECCPALQIPFVGFVGHDPFYIDLNFWHIPGANGMHHEVIGQFIGSGSLAYSGSPVVAEMMRRSDSRIRQFLKPISECPSLQDAIDTTRGYIEVCASPLGLEVDPENCEGLGGHIHVATIAPIQRPSWFARLRGAEVTGGFQWVIPPK